MRWLCSALVGADCRPAVGSDKPSNSPPSSPEKEEDQSNKQMFNQLLQWGSTVKLQFCLSLRGNTNTTWRTTSVLPHWCQRCVILTHSEVNVAFASTHDQVGFGLRGRCVRGFRCRVIRAWICSAWRGHRLSCDKREWKNTERKNTSCHFKPTTDLNARFNQFSFCQLLFTLLTLTKWNIRKMHKCSSSVNLLLIPLMNPSIYGTKSKSSQKVVKKKVPITASHSQTFQIFQRYKTEKQQIVTFERLQQTSFGISLEKWLKQWILDCCWST